MLLEFFFFFISVFSGSFMGDIAVPGVEYGDGNSEKDRRAYAEKVEKYKKEINEGLQIEEEGIVHGTSKAFDVTQIKIRHRHNNRTRKNHLNKRRYADRPQDKTDFENSLTGWVVIIISFIARERS